MANINKISGIGVSSILKIRGLARAVLSKAKGRPFFVDTPSSDSTTLLSESTPLGDASYNASTDVMTFDGTGDYATFAGDWKHTDAITFGTWFKTSATGDRRIMSSHVRSGSPVRNGFLLYLNNGRLDFFEPSFSAGNFTHTGPTGMNDGQWHHVALAWNANSNWVLYVDGQQYSTSSNGAQAPAYMDGWDLYIGANPWLGNNPYGFFNGQIGGAFVENEAMSLDQIQTIYNNGPEYVASTATPAGNFIESNLSPGNISSGDNILGNNTTYDETEGKLVVTGSGHTKIDVAGELTSIPFNDDGSEKVAISMWLKLDEWSSYPILFSSRNESGNQLFNMRLWRNNGFMVGSRHSKSAASTANLFTNVGPANTVNNLSDGSWHNLVYYFDGATSGEQRIYLDGSLIATRQHSDGAGQGETNYIDSAMRYFGIGDLNNASVIGGEYDSIVLYQGFEFTEAMAAEVYADSTRQTIISQP